MLEGLLGSLVNTVVAGVFSLAGASGGLAAGVGLPAAGYDVAQDPLAYVETLVVSPIAAAEVFTAAGLPGIETSALLATGDYEDPTVVGAGAYIPLTDSLYAVPGGEVPLMLATSAINTIGATLGSVLYGLPINILGGAPLL